MRPAFALLLLLALAACASQEHVLANCTGPVETFASSSWQPTQAELEAAAARLN